MIKRTKILFVASEFASGMIPYAATIINTLANNPKLDVSCLCVNSGNKSYKRHIDKSVKATFIEYPSNKFMKFVYKFFPVKIYRNLMALQKQENPDVIHFLTGDFSLALSLMGKRINSSLYYYTVHDLVPHETVKQSLLKTYFRKYYLWGNKMMREQINNLTTSSRSQADQLKKMYPSKHIFYMPFPSLMTKDIANGEKEVFELCDIGPYILFFGNINKYKGIDLLLKAYSDSRLKDKIKLVVAGKGDMYDNLMGSEIIRINRFIDDQEVACLFRKASFVVYPYRSATMSGVLSLAFYYNKSVLLSDIPFFKEYDSPLCTYFHAKDVGDLTNKLKVMVERYERKELNRETNSYDSFFSSANLVDSYYRMYNH